MQDDVIIVDIRVILFMRPIAVIEGEAGSCFVNEFGGGDTVTTTVIIRVV
jgi:hypothetical protein